MKKIGLIGGVGPESTIEYYRLLIKTYQDRLSTKDYHTRFDFRRNGIALNH
jgi:aspartate racemase